MPGLTVDLSEEIDNSLTRIANKNGISKAQAMRKAFALLSIADEVSAKGNSLGIVKEDPKSDTLKAIGRVVGI